jgi:uncharacterized protein
MFGTLTDTQIEETLSANILGRIGCYDGDKVYIVPISYAYKDNTIYCHTREGMKIDMMRKNPNVCFEVDELSNMANWKSVIAWGKFEEIDEHAQRHDALEYLVQRVLPLESSETTHLAPNWPFRPDNLNEIKGIVFKITIDTKTGRYEHYLNKVNR